MIDETRVKMYISNYIQYVNTYGIDNHLNNEAYKFSSVDTFQRNFDLEAEDLVTNISSSILSNNLSMGGMFFPRRMLLIFAEEYPNETRYALNTLFNENLNIKSRIDDIIGYFKEIVRRRNTELKRSDQTYIDIRFLSLLLSLKYPNIYYHVKAKEYNIFCYYINDTYKEESKGLSRGEQYILYSQHADSLCNSIQNFARIREIKSKFTESITFKDLAFKWMTQDIIFTIANNQPTKVPSDITNILDLVLKKKQVILYGPSGTGKTYKAKILSMYLIESEV